MKKIYIILIIFIVFFGCNKQNYDFELKSEFKEKTTLKDFKGKKLIIYFGYSFCPDICPMTLVLLANTLEKLNAQDDVFLAFISLDIKRDNDLKKSNEWLRYFYKNSSVLLAKDDNYLKKLSKNYGVIFEKIDMKDSFLKYTIAHSNDIFLFDENGKLYTIIKDLSTDNLIKQLKDFI